MSKDKSKNRKKLSRFWKIMLFVLILAVIIHTVLITVLSITIQTFPVIRIIYEMINKVLIMFYTVLLVGGGTIVGILSGMKKIKTTPIIQWIRKFLIICCIVAVFMSPILIVNGACSPVIEYFEEKYKVEVKKIEEENIINKKDDVLIIVDYKDPLFNKYNPSFLDDNKYLISDEIVKTIKKPIINFNANVDKPNYERETQIAKDYELVYNYIRSQDLFKETIEERLDYPKKIVYHRNVANDYFKSSENQRQLGLRYKEAGDDYHTFKKFDEATMQYIDAIFWSLTGLQTSYNETEEASDIRHKLIENIIASYREIASVSDKNGEMYQRAAIMMDIFEYVKIQIR